MSGEALPPPRLKAKSSIGPVHNPPSSVSLGWPLDQRHIPPAEEGIAEMMVDLYRSAAEPVSEEMLFRWHRMVTAGPQRPDRHRAFPHRRSSRCRWSPGLSAPRGSTSKRRRPSRFPPKSAASLPWFNRTGPQGISSLPAITRAGIAHLYFESIHPFEDGNGRIGRALAEKALAQSFGQPALTGLATTILAHRNAYYDALERANKKNEITDWLAWFAEIALQAQHRTLAQVEFLIAKASCWTSSARNDQRAPAEGAPADDEGRPGGIQRRPERGQLRRHYRSLARDPQPATWLTWWKKARCSVRASASMRAMR